MIESGTTFSSQKAAGTLHQMMAASPPLPFSFTPSAFNKSIQLVGAGTSVKAPNSLDETWSINASLAIRKRARVSGSSSQSAAVGAPLSDINNSSGAGSGTIWGQVDPTRHLPPPTFSHLCLISFSNPLSSSIHHLSIHHHPTSLSSLFSHDKQKP